MKVFRFFIFALAVIFALFFLQYLNARDLSADQAFNLSISKVNNNTIKATWDIAKGFHLYKNQLLIGLAKDNGAELGKIRYPNGIKTHDDVLGNYEIYEGKLNVDIPIKKWGKNGVELLLKYQGCEGKLKCYPPISKVITIAPPKEVQTVTQFSTLQRVQTILNDNNIIWIIISFYIFGLFLSLTPCVLPMIPILSGIIIGQREIGTYKAFLLSLFYVLGMAITYTIAGIVTAMLGNSVQSLFQNFWVILFCGAIFVLLSLSLFGLYELRLPNFLLSKLTQSSNSLKNGTIIGVFFMGVISSLIVSPCVTAPLAGVLIYIATTGKIFIGAITLFSLSLGMGSLLIIIGTTGGKLFIKAGSWMNTVKHILGIAMLAMAIFLISRIIPEYITTLLWDLLLIGVGIYLYFIVKHKPFMRLIKLMALFIILIGIGLCFSIFINPYPIIRSITGNYTKIQLDKNQKDASNLFHVITTKKELNSFIELSKKEKKMIMLDFYADWCVSCKEMDLTVFKDPNVQKAMDSLIALRVDITKNTSETESLKKRYDVFAPPFIVFLDSNGKQLKQLSLAGTVSAKELLTSISSL